MGDFNIHFAWYFRMNGSHTAARAVIMHDQIVTANDAIVALNKRRDPVINLRFNGLS